MCVKFFVTDVTPILKLAMVKNSSKFVKKFVKKNRQKYRQKNLSKKNRKNSSKQGTPKMLKAQIWPNLHKKGRPILVLRSSAHPTIRTASLKIKIDKVIQLLLKPCTF